MLKHFYFDEKLNEVKTPDMLENIPLLNKVPMWFIVYFVFAGFLIALQNWGFSSTDDCVPQIKTIAVHTIVPLILIMGTTMIFLVVMNWNRIFANTFGLWFAPKLTLKSEGSDYSLFYNDPNILLQELETTDLFNLKNLNTKLKDGLGIKNININEPEHNVIKQQYYTKQNVGYFIWLTFTGIVSSLVSTNSILLQDCVIE